MFVTSGLTRRCWVTSLLLAALLVVGCKRAAPPQQGGQDTTGKQQQSAASITANPNPVPPGEEKFGKTTVSWDTGDGTPGEVYVSTNGGEEKRFSGAKAKGTQEAAWIGKGQYDFRLYAGKEHKTVLAAVTVKRGQ